MTFLEEHQPLDLGPTLIHCDFILTNCIYKDPVSKSGNILRFWVCMNWQQGWATQFNSVIRLFLRIIFGSSNWVSTDKIIYS